MGSVLNSLRCRRLGQLVPVRAAMTKGLSAWGGHHVRTPDLSSSVFPVFPDLLGAVPAGLHVAVIFFCGVVVLFSSVASGFFFFNAFGRPYEMLQGPAGLYLWTFICCEEPSGPRPVLLHSEPPLPQASPELQVSVSEGVSEVKTK